MVTNNKPVAAQNYNRLIIDSFIQQKAVHDQCSISYDQIRVPISDEVKTVFLNHLIKDEFVLVKKDQTMWFNKAKWDQTVNQLSKTYLAILAVPIVVVTGLAYLLSLI